MKDFKIGSHPNKDWRKFLKHAKKVLGCRVIKGGSGKGNGYPYIYCPKSCGKHKQRCAYTGNSNTLKNAKHEVEAWPCVNKVED